MRPAVLYTWISRYGAGNGMGTALPMDALQPGDPGSVGGYRLVGRLGAGGMGQVFLGVSPGGRRVAVKLIHPAHAGTAQFRERFAREVEAARRVGGFHTAPVVDADPGADPPWMVTAFIEGPSLQDDVDGRGPLPGDGVRALGAGLAEGLAAIHACGLVHRDLKPGNVILAPDGPRIIDFGIARAIGATTGLTSTGVVVGTLTYMSPEQIRGDPVGPGSDVFALGSVLAFAATGRAPFGDDSAATVMFRIFTEPPYLAGIADEPLRRIIGGCLAKTPADRPTLAALLAALGGATPAAAPAAPARAVPAAAPPFPSRAVPAAAQMRPQTQAPVSASTASGREPPLRPSGQASAWEAEPSPIASGRAGRGRAGAKQRRRTAIVLLPAALVILAAAVGWLLTHSPHAASPSSDPQITATRDASLRGKPTPAITATESATSRTPAAQATSRLTSPADGSTPTSTPQAYPAGGSVFSHQFGTHSSPNYALDVLNNGATAGQPIILFHTGDSDPAEQWTVSLQGTTANFYKSGLVGAAVAQHYGCIPGVNFQSCYGQTAVTVNDPAFELEYAPNGAASGLCMGVASTAVQGEDVTLQPCGVSAKTVWIEDVIGSPSTLSNGYIPLINGSDTNFSQPFVLTYPASGYPTDFPRPQLVVDEITGSSQGFPPRPELGTVEDNQLWGA
jgi:serine/threonine protein kinase